MFLHRLRPPMVVTHSTDCADCTQTSYRNLNSIQAALAPKAETKDNTKGVLETILASVKNIEADLMIPKPGSASSPDFVDPVANFPILTPKHKSLAAGVLQNRPDLYTKYCNAKTANGFSFDDVIQVSGLTVRVRARGDREMGNSRSYCYACCLFPARKGQELCSP